MLENFIAIHVLEESSLPESPSKSTNGHDEPFFAMRENTRIWVAVGTKVSVSVDRAAT